MKKQIPKTTKLQKTKPSRAATPKKSAQSCKGGEEKQIQPVNVFVGVDTQGNITYSVGNPNKPQLNGDVDVPPGGQVRFISNGYSLVWALEPSKVKGEIIDKRFGAGKPKVPIVVDVPTGALRNDTYKYSVAVITKGEILISDPILRIYS